MHFVGLCSITKLDFLMQTPTGNEGKLRVYGGILQ